jgi:hypothetical protein
MIADLKSNLTAALSSSEFASQKIIDDPLYLFGSLISEMSALLSADGRFSVSEHPIDEGEHFRFNFNFSSDETQPSAGDLRKIIVYWKETDPGAFHYWLHGIEGLATRVINLSAHEGHEYKFLETLIELITHLGASGDFPSEVK